MTRISSEVFFVCNEIWDKNNFVECSFLRNYHETPLISEATTIFASSSDHEKWDVAFTVHRFTKHNQKVLFHLSLTTF